MENAVRKDVVNVVKLSVAGVRSSRTRWRSTERNESRIERVSGESRVLN